MSRQRAKATSTATLDEPYEWLMINSIDHNTLPFDNEFRFTTY